jgi:hypothetical protein
MGLPKTIIVVGDFQATLTIEVSEDAGVTFGSLRAFNGPDVHEVDVAARYLRVKISGYEGGPLPVVGVGSVGTDTLCVALPLPPGIGVGVAVDVSAFGSFKTVIVGPVPEGTVVGVEGSVDGVNFAAIVDFLTGSDLKSFVSVLKFARIRVAGAVTGPLPQAAMCAIDDGIQASPDVVVVPNGVSACIPANADVVRFTTDDNEPQLYLPSVASGDDGRQVVFVHTSGDLDAILLPNSLTEGVNGLPGASYTFPALDVAATFEADVAGNIWRLISSNP